MTGIYIETGCDRRGKGCGPTPALTNLAGGPTTAVPADHQSSPLISEGSCPAVPSPSIYVLGRKLYRKRLMHAARTVPDRNCTISAQDQKVCTVQAHKREMDRQHLISLVARLQPHLCCDDSNSSMLADMEQPPAAAVRVVSRRMVRPSSEAEAQMVTVHHHLPPWDLQMLTVDYIQKGLLLPKPPAAGSVHHLASAFSRALRRFYPFAGRLAVQEDHGPSVTVSLRCDGEGAEFVHAVAPDVTVADVSSLYVPRVVWSFFPLDGLVGADAAAGSRPLLAAQVTELADGVFVAMSLSHAVADGTAFWHLFNTWSEISRSGGDAEIPAPSPVLERWFPDACPVPIPLPFAKLEHIVRRFDCPPVEECFLHFSAERIRELKARANAEVASEGGEISTAVSSLQSLLAHVWRAVSRARRLPPQRETTYTVLVGCRGRVKSVPQAYAGNAVVRATARSTAGEITDRGLGWTASLLNRAVASLDEAALVGSASSWPAEPRFAYLAGFWDPAMVVTGNSPRFDAYGNDFGWGAPVAVRSGGANKVDGRVTVYEGRGGDGAMALEVCLSPDALARLVADDEFMETTA